MATRPEPTIIGNCDSWIFIVGKKPVGESPSNLHLRGVAKLQQGFYTQLIHSCISNNAGQLVGELWITCVLHRNIPHRERGTRRYAIGIEQRPLFYRI